MPCFIFLLRPTFSCRCRTIVSVRWRASPWYTWRRWHYMAQDNLPRPPLQRVVLRRQKGHSLSLMLMKTNLRGNTRKLALSLPHIDRIQAWQLPSDAKFFYGLFFPSDGRLDVLLWISCLFEPGYSTLDHGWYLTRLTLLLGCQINVGLDSELMFGVDFSLDLLNRIDPAYHQKPKIKPHEFVDPDPREQTKNARHLSKYVFPRQYGLSNPFVATSRKKETFNLLDYSDREVEIKVHRFSAYLCMLSDPSQTKGSCKTPKRLKDTLHLLETMIWRHGKCGYKPLRDIACPSKVGVFDMRVAVNLFFLSLSLPETKM